MTPLVDVQQYGRVLELALNRPDKRNALNHEMCAGLVNGFVLAERDPSVGAILLKANGTVFCSGMDLEEASGHSAAADTAIHARLFDIGARITKPIVCQVNGPALAGGLGLVANAHIAIAAHGSTFGLTEIRIGMWPYAIYRALEAALGPRRSLELTLTSKIFNTPEAFAWGLVHEVVPPFELDERGMSIAASLANASTETIERGMRFAAAARGLSRDEAMAMALETRSENFQSLDFAEGVKAFRERRAPRWPSHP